MFNRRSLYLFLLSATICSLIWGKIFFLIILGASLITIFILNRGIFFTLRANRYLSVNNVDKGYPILEKAVKTNTVPYMVINGYIYISLKLGKFQKAIDTIDRVLSGSFSCTIKQTHKNQALTLKALYLLKVDKIKEALEILDSLHDEDYVNTIFYGIYGYLLYLDKQFEKAEKVCLEAHDYGVNDKVTLDNLLSIYLATNELKKAEESLDKLLTLNPKFPEAFYHAAEFYLIKDDFNMALSYIDKALDMKVTYISSITRDDILKLKDKIEEKQK